MPTNVGEKIQKCKRRIVTERECKYDLNKELNVIFLAFWEAVKMYEEDIVRTPPEARPRGFDASLMQAKMIQCFQKYFPESWRFGKYKRFILNINGYIILPKKLNGKDMPMNIKTQHTTSIANQLQLPLFGESTATINPIVFFGYKKSKLGEILDPKLVYIDEEKLQWTITASDNTTTKNIVTSTTKTDSSDLLTINQDLKVRRKAVNQ